MIAKVDALIETATGNTSDGARVYEIGLRVSGADPALARLLAITEIRAALDASEDVQTDALRPSAPDAVGVVVEIPADDAATGWGSNDTKRRAIVEQARADAIAQIARRRR